MTEQMNVPKLRFGEFKGEWSTKKVKDICPLQRGFDLPTTQVVTGEYPVVYSNGIGRFHAEYKVKAPGIVTGRSGTIGNLTLVEHDYWPHNTSLWVTNFFDNDVKFIFYLLNKLDLKRFSTGSGVPTLNRNDVHDHKATVPNPREQQKVASFLSKVDEKIALLTEKKDKLTEYKKGVMQQLFNGKWEEQDGQLTFIPPTLRFKANDGSEFPDWEEIELGKLSKKSTVKNKDNSVSVVLTNSATQGIISQADYFDRDIANQSNLDGYYVVNPDDFVYNPRISIPAPVGPINRNKIDVGVMSPLYTVFSVKKGLNLSYLEYFFKTTNWHRYMNSIANFGARHDRMNITTSDFFKMPIPVPCIAEQNKIVHFVSSIDQKIDLANSELDKTKEWKKGLLQQMFV